MIWLGIKPHAADRLQVSQLSRPPGRVTLSGLLANLMALLEYVAVQAGMALSGCDIANLAVAMLVVVPANETMHPQTRRPQAFEPSGG